MLVKQAMTSKTLIKFSPNDSFKKIVKTLIEKQISGAPVVNKRGKLVGVVSEKDLFYKLFPSQKAFYKNPEMYMDFNRIESEAVVVRRMRAKDFMTRQPITIEPDEHILKACSLFIKNNIRRLMVVKGKKLIGVVTINDVYKRFLSILLTKSYK